MGETVYFSRTITPEKLPERINSRHGVHSIEAAAGIGYGGREYTLVTVD